MLILSEFLQKPAQLSDEQISDLLYLRRLYIHRKAMLQMQRQALISKPYVSNNVQHPQQDLDHVDDMAAALKQIALQDCKAYHQVSHAMTRGVSPLITFT